MKYRRDNRLMPYSILCLLVLSLIHGVTSQVKFLEQPKSQVVTQGETMFLNCRVENANTRLVQWVKNGFGLGPRENITSSYPRYAVIGSLDLGEHTLMISNVNLREDDATFECQIGADQTSAGLRSSQAIVTVQVQPDKPVVEGVVEGSSDVSVVDGKPFELTCHVNNGRPVPTITWKTGGAELTENIVTTSTPVDGKLTNVVSKLTITPTKADQGKPYECQALNSAMSQAMLKRVNLNVAYPPIVTMQVSPHRRLREFSSVKFTCEATANPSTVKWKWFKNGVEVEKETSNTYVVHSITRELHTKAIECEADNTIGQTKHSYTLNIEYSPRITKPDHPSADEGKDATLKCEVDGNPPPAVVWRKAGSTNILSSTNELVLQQVTAADFGPYICTASIIGFPEVQEEVHLLKKGPPILGSEIVQSARYGDTGVVICTVESIPKPAAIQWTRNGEVIDPKVSDSRYRVREEPTLRGMKSILEIINVQETDFGQFNCTVTNDYGARSQAITFIHKNTLTMPYIIAVVLGGVLIVIIIVVVVFIYRRVSAKGGSSNGSEASISRKEQMFDYRSPPPHREPIYRSAIDFPRPADMMDPRYGFRRSADYDELMYPRDPRSFPDMRVDGSFGPSAYYGTYPGPAGIRRPPETSQFAPAIHYSEYGTYRPDYLASYGYQPAATMLPPMPPSTTPLPHPQSPAPSNQLSTNV